MMDSKSVVVVKAKYRLSISICIPLSGKVVSFLSNWNQAGVGGGLHFTISGWSCQPRAVLTFLISSPSYKLLWHEFPRPGLLTGAAYDVNTGWWEQHTSWAVNWIVLPGLEKDVNRDNLIEFRHQWLQQNTADNLISDSGLTPRSDPSLPSQYTPTGWFWRYCAWLMTGMTSLPCHGIPYFLFNQHGASIFSFPPQLHCVLRKSIIYVDYPKQKVPPISNLNERSEW